MMDGCDEKYKRKKSIQSIQSLWTDCTQKGMKRYAKKYYITKIQLGWTDERICQQKRKRNIIQLGWTDMPRNIK